MRCILTYMLLCFSCVGLFAQGHTETGSVETASVVNDSAAVAVDSALLAATDSIVQSHSGSVSLRGDGENVDTLTDGEVRILTAEAASFPATTLKTERWVPDPKKSMWLAIVFPGGGQIYNRKYWKLPLIYGGFIGCIYALSWNGSMYRDYSQAYMDIMDNDPNTKSYENFLPSTYDVEGRKEYLQDLFRRKKNYFRRYRDLSLFCMIGVYLLSIVDAYVDAELSSFDISRDLTMKVRPAVINERQRGMWAGNGSSYGLQCRLNF